MLIYSYCLDILGKLLKICFERLAKGTVLQQKNYKVHCTQK